MHFNLISIGKLDDESYHNHLGDGKSNLNKGSLITASGRKINTLYKTNERFIKGGIIFIENEIFIKLWHKKLGHISEKGLQILVRK